MNERNGIEERDEGMRRSRLRKGGGKSEERRAKERKSLIIQFGRKGNVSSCRRASCVL